MLMYAHVGGGGAYYDVLYRQGFLYTFFNQSFDFCLYVLLEAAGLTLNGTIISIGRFVSTGLLKNFLVGNTLAAVSLPETK